MRWSVSGLAVSLLVAGCGGGTSVQSGTEAPDLEAVYAAAAVGLVEAAGDTSATVRFLDSVGNLAAPVPNTVDGEPLVVESPFTDSMKDAIRAAMPDRQVEFGADWSDVVSCLPSDGTLPTAFALGSAGQVDSSTIEVLAGWEDPVAGNSLILVMSLTERGWEATATEFGPHGDKLAESCEGTESALVTNEEEAYTLAEQLLGTEAVRFFVEDLRSQELTGFVDELGDLDLVAYGFDLLLRQEAGEELRESEPRRLAELGFTSEDNSALVAIIIDQLGVLRQARQSGALPCGEQVAFHGDPAPDAVGYPTPDEAIGQAAAGYGSPVLAFESGDTTTWHILDERGEVVGAITVGPAPAGGFLAGDHVLCADVWESGSKGAAGEPSAAPPQAAASVQVALLSGEDPCSSTVLVERLIDETDDPIAAAYELLVAGTTDQDPRDAASWFSAATAGSVRSVTLHDDLLVVDFEEVILTLDNASTSCGSEALLAQLNGTAFQFPHVQRVTYALEGSCDAFFGWLQRDCHEYRRP